MAAKTLDHKRLLEALDYDPVTGIFVWKMPPQTHPRLAGHVAGTVRGDEYKARYIQVDGMKYRSSRLAVFYMTGAWPDGLVDHIDRDPLDDRYENLRVTDALGNASNHSRLINGSNLPTGVRVTAAGNYTARIRWMNKPVNIGTFPTSEMASNAYRCVARILRGEYVGAAR